MTATLTLFDADVYDRSSQAWQRPQRPARFTCPHHADGHPTTIPGHWTPRSRTLWTSCPILGVPITATLTAEAAS